MKKKIVFLMVGIIAIFIILLVANSINNKDKVAENISQTTKGINVSEDESKSKAVDEIIYSPLVDKYTVKSEYDNDDVYLVNDEGQKLAGPYAYIYIDDVTYKDDLCRIISKDSHKIGFVNMTGEMVAEPEYIEADKMTNGCAAVRDNVDGMYYYINSKGIRINSEEYMEAYPFVNNMAKVKFKDGTWGIINKSGSKVIDGLDYINNLPSTTTMVSGLKDGKAIILKLDEYDSKFYEIRSFDYTDISEVYYENFVIVKNENQEYGVLDVNSGKSLIDNKYKKIEFTVMPDEHIMGEKISFRCQNVDGTYDIEVKSFGNEVEDYIWDR